MPLRVGVVSQSARVALGELHHVLSGVNAQQSREFKSAWGKYATLHATSLEHAPSYDVLATIEDDPPEDGIGGWHEDETGQPRIRVFTSMAAAFGQPWSVLLSHEVCETAADPFATFLAGPFPHPADGRSVAIWLEVCDPVEAVVYVTAGVTVSDFVYPAWFAPKVIGSPRIAQASTSLRPGEVAQGGYLGFYDAGGAGTWFRPADVLAQDRAAIKEAYAPFRRPRRRKMRAAVP